MRGVALSGIAAENLESGSGIASRTIASLEHHWAQGRELLAAQDVLVIDEAGMIGSRQLERVLGEAERRGAKVVLVGDPEQLQAIEAGAAFRSLTERHSHVEIAEVRRQHERWQQQATRELGSGRVGEALDAYRDHGMVHCAETRDRARADLIEGWTRDRAKAPEQTRIILTHTNDEVCALNDLARGSLREAGELGEDVSITVERGRRDFACGDRVMFLKNDRGLGLKNGSLGIVEAVDAGRMTVQLDVGRPVAFDLKDYAHLDHGYAATIHKAQGMTVDRAHVLATPGLDRHAAYVALSRHRESVQLHYGRDDFADEAKLVRSLSRDRSKDMASDYERHCEAPGRFKTELSRKEPERPPEPQRRNEPGIFASFRPIVVSQDRNAPNMARERVAAPDLHHAVRRYARSILEVAKMRELALPILPHQIAAREHADAVLDALRPQAPRDLDSVFDRDPALVREAAEGRTQRAIRAMQVEAEIRTDPKLRADRFVKRWQELDHQRTRLARDNDWQGERKTRASMGAMAKSLERDPQMESMLRTRSRDLGIPKDMGRGIGRNLLASMSAFLSAELIRRSVETRRASCAFIAAFRAVLMSSRSMAGALCAWWGFGLVFRSLIRK